MNVISVDPGIVCTGIYVFKGGAGYSVAVSRPRGRENYQQLVYIRNAILAHAEGCDFALVEDYFYSETAGMTAYSIEAGAVVREILAELGIPIIVIAIPTWQSLTTIGRRKKGTSEEKANYLEAVRVQFGPMFDTTDEADAFLIYQTALRIWKEGPRTDSQRRIMAQMRRVSESGSAR